MSKNNILVITCGNFQKWNNLMHQAFLTIKINMKLKAVIDKWVNGSDLNAPQSAFRIKKYHMVK
jgi:hypothetical protein